MARRFFRWLLLLVLAASVAGTVLTAIRISADPGLSATATADTADIALRAKTLLAAQSKPQAVQAALRLRLNDHPRDWLILTALVDFAARQAIPLPPDLTDALAIAREDDHGLYAFATACPDCAADPGLCPYAQVLICRTPLAPLPGIGLSDLPAIATAALGGDPADQAALAFAIVALRADDLAPDAETDLRDGADLARLGSRMALTSPVLTGLAVDAALDGVNWAALPTAATAADLAEATRIDAFSTLAETALSLQSLQAATSPQMALHLLPIIESPADAEGLVRLSAALGGDLPVAVDLVGKSALLRAQQSPAKTGWALVAGLAGIWISLALLLRGWLWDRRRSPGAAPDEAD